MVEAEEETLSTIWAVDEPLLLSQLKPQDGVRIEEGGAGGGEGGGAPSKLRAAKVGWQPAGFFTVKIFR